MNRRRIISDLLFIVIISFLALASVLSYVRITHQNQSSGLVSYANFVKYKMGETLNQLRSAEKKEQDSIHTRNFIFNFQMLSDSTQAFQRIHELDSLTLAENSIHEKLSDLKILVHKWLQNLYAEHVLARDSKNNLSDHIFEGQSLLSRIQLLMVEMRHAEDDLLLREIQEKDRTAFLTPLYSLVFSLIAILIVTGAYFRLRSETRLRMKAEDEQAVQKEFQNRLQEAESRSRLAIEAAQMGTFDWDLQNQRFISSERLVEIFGYQNASQINHQDLIDRFHPEDRSIRDAAVNQSLEQGSLKYEIRLIWPDKSIHWVNVYGKIFADDARHILRMYGTVMDITPQKLALEELRESESKFRLLANTMPQQIWTADKNGNLNYFNQAVYDFSGYQGFAEIEEKGWLSIVHPDERAENIRKWTESVENGNEFIFEHRFRNVQGQYRWQLSRAIPQKDEQGNIQMWIGTSTDIHEQKNFMQELEKNVFERTQSLNYANLALKQTVSELEQSNAELASFNYIASHDLQEPLRKIIAFSKHIEEVDLDNLSPASRDYFDRIVRAASRMQSLIDAFLSYSQTTNIRAELERVDFNEVFRDVKNDFSEVIEQEQILLESEELPVLMGISLQINQLFTNLIGNAIKYKKSGVKPEIHFRVEKLSGAKLDFEGVDVSGQYWKIAVQDNGIGFDQAHAHQIFELFQRLHSRQEYAGTGIGLAICKKIMRNHRGFIHATSQIGSGAEFSMYFPVLSGR